jgi:nucleolar protein 53
VGDSSISRKYPKHRNKTLKADEIIASRSAIPAISLKKRPGEQVDLGILSTKRVRTDYVSQKELNRLREVADGHHEGVATISQASYDVWNNETNTSAPEGFNYSLPSNQKIKRPNTMSQKPVSLAANGKEIPAMVMPTGGYSYNPMFSDYERRFAKESAKAISSELNRLEIELAEQSRQEAAMRSAAEAEAAEAKALLSEWEEDSAWEGFDSSPEDNIPAVKQPKRKTQAQRNKIKRRKEEERLAKHNAAMKKKIIQAEKIDEIAREVSTESVVISVNAETESESEGNPDQLRKKQLGKFRLPENDLEFILPDELQDSLRLLKPEGNLLKDRYRSMLMRGKMESRRHIPFKKRAKTKLKEKWTHKDFVI